MKDIKAFEIRKGKLREVKLLIKGHTANILYRIIKPIWVPKRGTISSAEERKGEHLPTEEVMCRPDHRLSQSSPKRQEIYIYIYKGVV